MYREFGMPSPEEWTGKDGTINRICDGIQRPRKSHYGIVRNVLNDIVECSKAHVTYTGERRQGSGGSNVLIRTNSEDAQTIADLREHRGYSISRVTAALNVERAKKGLAEYGESAVYNLISRLKPVKIVQGVRKQGNKDKDSPWAKARLNFDIYKVVTFGSSDVALPLVSSKSNSNFLRCFKLLRLYLSMLQKFQLL
jgi:hypothetical protein